MSQKKVDEYKKFKANRKEIFAKEKRTTFFCVSLSKNKEDNTK